MVDDYYKQLGVQPKLFRLIDEVERHRIQHDLLVRTQQQAVSFSLGRTIADAVREYEGFRNVQSDFLRQQAEADRYLSFLKQPSLLDAINEWTEGSRASSALKKMLDDVGSRHIQITFKAGAGQNLVLDRSTIEMLESAMQDAVGAERLDALTAGLVSVGNAVDRLPHAGASDDQLRTRGLTRMEWFTVYMALLQVIFFFLSHAESIQQGRFAREEAVRSREADQLAATETRLFREQLLEVVARLEERAPRASAVVGKRSARVKARPSGGDLLDIAYPNQVVLISAKEGRWVKVRYRNHLEDRDVEGWMLSKYLVRGGSAE